ncbi:MAG TPA: ABC transporter ATP-binding protein [Candidatus Egerieisoma faecipullorum]|uniref:ABC transporter ATP-binding protein n=1 Tax=Candidatus Egerieisoma faecipullorum TaxID=2840963 RepID=A0A9D1I7L7_9CLOT|nr:ABC transporter ATP-binding protein [Candidatus Egerieisoma faecipullorum]
MLIECKNVCLAYENHTVLSNLSFPVRKGDYLCIIGENGSGKTTLMRALLGLKSVEKGSIVMGDGLKQNEIGYLPQQTGLQKDFPASVWEVVLSGRINRLGFRPFFSKEDKRIADRNLERLGIAALKTSCYRELSGGQQQRVLLARALCAAQKVLLLDEPAAGLDRMATEELYHIIFDLNRHHGITIIMITHDVDRALRDATHILHLHKDETFFGDRDRYLECATCRQLTEEERREASGGCGHA